MLKTLAIASVLTVIPLLSYAQCREGHEQQAMSCAQGLVWDLETSACVPVASS